MIENLAVGATARQEREFVATIRELVETRELGDQALTTSQTRRPFYSTILSAHRTRGVKPPP
jgi:hypothetical protein